MSRWNKHTQEVEHGEKKPVNLLQNHSGKIYTFLQVFHHDQARKRHIGRLKYLRIFTNDETAYSGEFRSVDTKSNDAQSTVHAFQGV